MEGGNKRNNLCTTTTPSLPPPIYSLTHSLTHPNNILSNMLKLEQLFIDDDT